MSRTTKPKATTPKRINDYAPLPDSEASILDPAQARREVERWEGRFCFLASRDPIQFKHLHRRVINSGLSWEEMVDKERGSFPDKGI